MKNPQRMSPSSPSVQSYRHFTEILASGVLYTDKPNESISSYDLPTGMSIYK
jgi:hypothetical protein